MQSNETYTNMISILWNPGKDTTPKTQTPIVSKIPQKFSIRTEIVGYFPINYHLSKLPTDTKMNGVKVKSLSVPPDSKTAANQKLK